MNDVEVVLHRGAVSAADAGGEEEEQCQDRGQPAARQDTVPDISRSPRQHAVESLKALGEDGGAVVRNTSPTVQGYSKQEENLEKAKKIYN